MIPRFLCILFARLLSLAVLPTSLQSALLTQCDESAMRAAMEQGGLIQFGCDAVIPISSIITISKPVTLDANGHSVTLSGQKRTQLFMVGPEGELTLRGLSVVDGYSVMNGGAIWVSSGILNLYRCRFLTNGAYAEKNVAFNGFNSYGGAIYNVRGKVTAVQCRFMHNTAVGGAGGVAGAGGEGFGGAFYSQGGSLALTQCDFISNTALGGAGGAANGVTTPGGGGGAAGGSIFLNNAELTVVDSDFLGCISFGGDGGLGNFSRGSGGLGRGGAIATRGTSSVVIQGANLRGNFGEGGNSGRGGFGGSAQGGAVYCGPGQLVLRDSKLEDNEALPGFGNPHGGLSAVGQGGALFTASTSTVTRCLFQNNKASGGTASSRPSGPRGGNGEGGAIYHDGPLTVDRSALISNRAQGGSGVMREGFGFPPDFAPGGDGLGGGIFSGGGEVRVLNSTVANNVTLPGTAPSGGGSGLGIGGALYSEGNGWIQFATIARNESSGGSVVSQGLLHLENSIVAYGIQGSNLVGNIVDLGHNICSDASLVLSGKGSRASTDPLLLPLSDNGGPTPTMALVLDSPAVDTAVDDNPPATDQRGTDKPSIKGLDIGAYELHLTSFRISSFQFGANQRIALSGTGPFRQLFVVEVSSNLRDWQQAAAGQVDGTGHWSVEVPNTQKTSFFRAK